MPVAPSCPTSAPVVVVVAEDEVLIRMMAIATLADEGFVVIGAETAEEALAVVQSQADDVRVLFSDIHMPGSINGLDLAHHVRARWPWIGVLLTSGKAPPEAPPLPAGSRFLPKPYDLDHVVAHVRELVAA